MLFVCLLCSYCLYCCSHPLFPWFSVWMTYPLLKVAVLFSWAKSLPRFLGQEGSQATFHKWAGLLTWLLPPPHRQAVGCALGLPDTRVQLPRACSVECLAGWGCESAPLPEWGCRMRGTASASLFLMVPARQNRFGASTPTWSFSCKLDGVSSPLYTLQRLPTVLG